METFFISDCHFGHKNVIKYCNRPYSSVEEMDEDIISKWNKKVHKNDIVYIVGDLFYFKINNAISILDRLKGKLTLIRGNHDDFFLKKINVNKYFQNVSLYEEISLRENKITLCHYPMYSWKNSRRQNSYLVFGHVHNNKDMFWFDYYCQNDKTLNAGVDINNFEPVNFDELKQNNEEFKRCYRVN